MLLILALALAISAVSWILALRQIAFERQEAIRTATAQNDDRALMLQQYVSRILAAANLASLHIAELHDLGALPLGTASRPRLIDRQIARDPGFLGLSVVDEAGDVVATTLDGPERTPNVGAHPAFAVHRSRDSRGLFVSRPIHSRLLRSDTIWLSRRLNRPDGGFAGVVAINLKPAQLTAIFGQTAVSPSESAWVVGLDGVIRSRLSGGVASSGQDVNGNALFRRQQHTESGRFAGLGALDGKMRLVSHRRVPGYPLFVSHSALQDDVLRGPRLRGRLLIGGAALATIATAIIAALMIYALRQRERRALELSIAKARLEEAQRIAQVGDWARSFKDQTTSWSPQLFEMYERDPALGPLTDEFESLLPEKSIELLRESVTSLVERGAPVSWEFEVRLPSGRTRYHRVSAVPTRDRHGAIVGFHGTTQDVTESKKLQALQDELAHASRIGALNALAATLSHELNQPLTAANNYLGAGRHVVAGLEDEKKAPALDLLKEVQGQILRIAEIIRRMRKLVSKDASEQSVVSIDQVLNEALAIISVTKACPYPLILRGAEDELLFRGDGVQIQQVILNLVRNACEAQQGRDVPPPRVEVSSRAGKIRVSVIDHGPGFPRELLQKLGEPFMSSKQSGLGLGLSISRTIIEAHGGALVARNNPSGGASVTFTLPLHGKRPREAPKATEAAPATDTA